MATTKTGQRFQNRQYPTLAEACKDGCFGSVSNKSMDADFWDGRVKSVLHAESRTWKNYNYYLSSCYRRLLETCFKFLAGSVRPQSARILKTDLWDICIEPDRCVLATVSSLENADVCAIDISTELVNKAKQMGMRHVYQGDIRSLPFHDQSFDLILDCSTIDHVEKEAIDKVIAEYHRVLVDDGVALIVYARKSLLLKMIHRTLLLFLNKDIFKFYEEKYGQFFFDDTDVSRIVDKHHFKVRKKVLFGTLLIIPSKLKLTHSLMDWIPRWALNILRTLELAPLTTHITSMTSLLGAYIVQKELRQ